MAPPRLRGTATAAVASLDYDDVPAGELVRIEPFDVIEMDVADIFAR